MPGGAFISCEMKAGNRVPVIVVRTGTGKKYTEAKAIFDKKKKKKKKKSLIGQY